MSSYFTSTNRPRSYSKPTKEELKELNQHLAQLSQHELQQICQLAASESLEVAHVLMRCMSKNANIFTPGLFHPVKQAQQNQPLLHESSTRATPEDTGLLTPAETSEDSEMSGTENVQRQGPWSSSTPPVFQQYTASSPSVSVSVSFSSSKNFSLSPLNSRRAGSKRKSLADRDDNIPTPTHSSTFLSSSCKKRRAAPSSPSVSISNDSKSRCLNCGHVLTTSKWSNLHGCIYHPGTLSSSSTQRSEHEGQWTCCNSRADAPGCLVSRHRDVIGPDALKGTRVDEQGNCLFAKLGMDRLGASC